MTTININPKRYINLIHTRVPIQIWPDPTETEIPIPVKTKAKAGPSFSQGVQKQLLAFIHGVAMGLNGKTIQQKKEQKRVVGKSHQTGFPRLSVNWQGFYRIGVVVIVIAAVSVGGYFAYIQFNAQQEQMAKQMPATSFGRIAQALEHPTVSVGLPVRLEIPIINVNAAVQQVGLTQTGALDVPTNTTDVGWYKLGPRPGEVGSAVIDAHFDGPNGLPAVFSRLDNLKVGDSIIVIDGNNKPVYFIIKKLTNYETDDFVSGVFNDYDGGIHLNLITCNGIWDVSRKTYTQRLVVFADAIKS